MNAITWRILPALLAVMSMLLSACTQAEPVAETAPEMAAETIMETTAAAAEPAALPGETEPQQERFLLTFVGDCTFGTHPGNYNAEVGFVRLVGEDYRYPFENVIDYFENDEFSFLNLEGPLCDEGTAAQKRHTFRGPTEFVKILTENSIEAVTLANNHTLDYGQSGYASTVAVLEEAGIPYVERDAGTLITTENGLTIGLYGAVYDRLDTEVILSGIRQLREQGAELVIFAPHWGYEGSFVPVAYQTELARAAIDAGADIVCGSHPHVLQNIEYYGNGVIYYSLGNFSFGGNGAPGDYDTALLQQEVIREPDGTVSLGELTRIPASVSSVSGWNDFRPTPYAPGSEGYDRVLRKLSGTWHQSSIKIG